MNKEPTETILGFFPAEGEVTLAPAFQAELRGIKNSLERCGLAGEASYSRMHQAHPTHFDKPVMFPGLTIRSGTLPSDAVELLRAFYSARSGRSITLTRNHPAMRFEAETSEKLAALCAMLQRAISNSENDP